MSTLVSFAALFLSVVFVQFGSGALGPLDALSGAASGFSTAEIGLLGSAHFAGFFVGCWITPRLMARVGHERAFASLAAIGVIGALLHPVLVDPLFWAALRVGTGVAVAGAYTIVESWLQAKVENANRGRVLGVYRVVDLGAQLGAQGLIAFLDPADYVSYNIVAVFASLCLIPLMVTRQPAPARRGELRLRPWTAARLSPLGCAGYVVSGLTSSSFRMIGPIFAIQSGLGIGQVALFLGAAIAGGAAAQIPVGWFADKHDRRWVLIGLSVAALFVSGAMAGAGSLGPWALLAGSFLFGAVAFPLSSVSAAHANDFCPPDLVVELNASLMLMFGLGAIVSPILAAGLITAYGPGALFAYVSAAHAVLIVFGLYRMTRRASPAARTAYRYLPRTSFTLARLFRRRGGNGG